MDLWDRLREEKLPLLLYGMGDGADKIIKALESRGIKLCGVFASDGFVRDKTFHGFKLMSFSQAEEKFGSFVALQAFGTSRKDVLENVKRISKRQRLYVPDVPVAGEGLFDSAFARKNKDKLRFVYSALATEADRYSFESVIRYKLSGLPSYLFRSSVDEEYAYRQLETESFKVCVDCGAFTGDTAAKIIKHCKGLKKLYAIEPDARSFAKLKDFCKDKEQIVPINAAVYSDEGGLCFSAKGSRGSRGGEGEVRVKTVTVDGILGGEGADFLKFDVEGTEEAAIEGAKQTIKKYKPKMLVSCYHKCEDMFALPIKVLNIRSDYKLHFFHPEYLPAWDSAFIFE